MTLQKYQIYDVTDDKVVEKDLTFSQVKGKIVEVWSDNEMQFNKIMRCRSLKVLNSFGEGLGYLIEPIKAGKRGSPNDYENTIYAYYEKDEYVCDGTVEEIAEKTGKTVQRLKRVASKSYKNYYGGKPGYMWMEELGKVGEI